MTARLAIFAAALAALTALTSPARAALPAPGCAGLAFSDERGDVPAFAGPTATNLDITDGYFVTDAAGKVTATMKVADMSVTPPPPATAVTWYMTWTVKDVTYYVSLDADVTGATTYETGTYGPDATGQGFSYQPAGPAKGTVTEGPDGGITWEVPKSAKGSAGQTLSQPAGQSFQLVQNTQGGGVLLFGDETDAEAGRSYAVGACESGSAAPPPPPPVAVDPPATSSPSPGSRPSSKPAAAPRLPVALVTPDVKAKRRKITIRLTATRSVTKIGARLRKGRQPLGTGRLASLRNGRTRALTLRLAKRPRKGSYVLDVTGRLPDGRLGTATFRLAVR